jgi:Domain of unknown function (DUF4148)
VQTIHFKPLNCSNYWNAAFNVKWFIDRIAMPTVRPIDEPNPNAPDSPRLDKTAMNKQAALPGIVKPFVLKEIVMNAKPLIAAAVLAVFGAAAGAAEVAVFGNDFPSTPSTLSRAEVRAETAKALASGDRVSNYEADLRGDEQTAASVRSRDDVRAEARQEARVASHSRSFDM